MKIALMLAWFAAVACLSPLDARADSLAGVFARGNRAYAKGDYPAAIAAYDELIEAGVDDPHVSYNLGTAHAKAKHYGQAIRYFEQSLKLEPGDGEVRRSLDKARQALGQKLATKTGEAVVSTRPPMTEALFAAFRVDSLAILLLSAVWLLTGCLFGLRRTHTEALRLGLGILGALSVVTAAVAGVGLGVKTDWGAEGKRAIVIKDEVALRDGPDEGAQSSLILREGTPVRVLHRERSFVEVGVGSDRRGYLPASDVGEI